MVEISLPKNSRPQPGKDWPKPEGAKRLSEFRVYRWNPDDSANPRIDVYLVDRDDCGPMVLDALIWIKSKVDSTLTFRRSCREGVMRLVRDEYRRRQHARLHQRHRRHRRRGENLSAAAPAGGQGPGADLTHFYAQHALIEPWLKTSTPTPEKEWRQSPEDRAKLDGLYECILCASCTTRVRAIGGTATAISVPLRCCRPIAG